MLKEILRSFLPWILFFLLTGHTQQQLDVAIIVAAVTSIIFEVNALRKGFILSWGTLIFFIFMVIAVILLRDQWVAKYSWIFSNGALALIAWISIFIRKPFTIQYAKEQVSKDKWQHPLFIKINYLLTAAWGLIFLISIGLHIIRIYYPEFCGSIYEVISYVPSIFGIWFTAWFPNWYKGKYIRENTHAK
jgi:lysylphosphatidylglycerol synthetase-like protein (DUF2156 family)